MQKQSREVYAKKYLEYGYELIGEYLGSTESNNVRCIKCGHVVKKRLNQCKERKCWGCYINDGSKSYNQKEAESLFNNNNFILLERYSGRYGDDRKEISYKCKCQKCSEVSFKTLASVLHRGCLKCLQIKRYETAVQTYAKNNFVMIEKYKGGDFSHRVKCTKCGDISRRRPLHDHRCKGCHAKIREEKIKLLMERYGSYEIYRGCVENITKSNIRKYNLFSDYEIGKKKYHIDHKVSVYYGYCNGIHPNIISHPSNLQPLWYSDNIRKNKKCSMSIEKLMESIEASDTLNLPMIAT